MQLLDLTRPIVHREGHLPRAPMPLVLPMNTHEETKKTRKFSSQNYLLQFIDHHGTHLDAPHHFNPDPDALSVDELPLDMFFTEAVCIDLGGVAPRAWVGLSEVQAALDKDGLDIRQGDTVLLYMGHYERFWGQPEFWTHYPGITREVASWFAERGVVNFGVEGPNPGHPSDDAFEVHAVCRDTGMLHVEGLVNLDQLAGRRFWYIGFPLKIAGGSGSPIRAVAVLDWH